MEGMKSPTAKKPALRQRGDIRSFDFLSDVYETPCYEVMVDGLPLRYVATNRMAFKRVESIFSKEPTTIPWLDMINPGEVLVDIGGNVGMYSIYAGAIRNARVFSFEPEALNYAELNKNIFVNGLHDRVSAFCLAISDEEKVGYLNLGTFGFGYSHHDFNENTWVKDKEFGNATTTKLDERLRQGSVSVSLDGLVARSVVPTPQHVKIDVDGIEYRVFRGAEKTFNDSAVRSVLIEIDFSIESSCAIIDKMVEMGWSYSMDQLRTNRKVVFTEEQIAKMRRDRVGGLNYIFYRDEVYSQMFSQFLDGYTPPFALKK